MALTLDPATKVISIPQADLTLVSGTLYELDTNQFRKDVFDLLSSEAFIWLPDAFVHNTEVTVAGVTFARTLEFINGFSIEFESLTYSVRLAGSNNNIFDVENGILVQNLVQVIAQNSAGLQTVAGGGGAALGEAQMNVSFEELTQTLYMEVWLDRDGVSVISGLVSCQVEVFDRTGTSLFINSSSSPGLNGRFSLVETSISLAANRPYNATVQVVDGTGTVTTFQAFSTVS